MKKILLTSFGFTTLKIKEEFLNLLNQNPSDLSAVIITTAHIRLKSQAPVSVKAQQAFESMGFRKVEFMDIEFESAEILDEYDVICLSGGNPFHLLHHLKLSGSGEKIKGLISRGVVLVGISAGTVVLGPDILIVDHFTPEYNVIGFHDLSALHLNEMTIFPHYGTVNKFPHEKSHETRIQEFETLYQRKVERMTDNEAIVIHGEVVKKITETIH